MLSGFRAVREQAALPSAEPTRAHFVLRETATSVCLLKNNQRRKRGKKEEEENVVQLATAVLPLPGAPVEDATFANFQSAASIHSVGKGSQRSVPGFHTFGVGFPHLNRDIFQ